MISWLKRVLSTPVPPSSKTHVALRVPMSVLDENIPRYPPFMQGLPTVDPEKLLATQQELIAQIASSVLTSRQIYEKHYLGAMRRFAGYAHLLPASQSHHHRGAGGLLRHSIEVGLWALQASDKMLLELGKTPLQRRELEPRWQLTAFLAGLCHDAGKPATDLTVSTHDRALLWKPIKENLWEWADTNSVDAYFLDWRPGRSKQHVALSNLIADRIITTETLAWIEEGGTELIVWLMESLNGNPGTANPLYDLVLKADQTSVERDLKSMGVAMAGYDLGVPVERHLTDIMRRLIKQGIWTINEPGARIWNIGGNIYLVWPTAGDEIARQVKDDGVPGIPRTGDGVLDMLVERHLAFVKPDADGASRFWKIAPAVLSAKIPDIALNCIRLRDDALVSSSPIAAVEGRILGAEPSGQASAAEEVADKPNGPTTQAATAASMGDESGQTNKVERQPRSQPISAAEASHNADQRPAPSIEVDPSTGEILTPLDGAGNPVREKLSTAPVSEQAPTAPTPAPPIQAKSIVTPKKTKRAGPPTLALDGACGEALKALAEDLKAGSKHWGVDARMEPDERVLLTWPSAFAGYGLTGKTILDELSEKGWLWIDQMAPLKKVQDFDEDGTTYKVIRLESEPSDAFAFAARYDGKRSEQNKKPPRVPELDAAKSHEPASHDAAAATSTQQAPAVQPALAEKPVRTPASNPASPPAPAHPSDHPEPAHTASQKPKQPKKTRNDRSMPSISAGAKDVDRALVTDIDASARENTSQAKGSVPNKPETQPSRPPSLTAVTSLKELKAKEAIRKAPSLEQVLAALKGKGDPAEDRGWEGLLLQKAKAAFKEAELEVERVHLFNLCKAHSDKLSMSKGMVLYRVD